MCLCLMAGTCCPVHADARPSPVRFGITLPSWQISEWTTCSDFPFKARTISGKQRGVVTSPVSRATAVRCNTPHPEKNDVQAGSGFQEQRRHYGEQRYQQQRHDAAGRQVRWTVAGLSAGVGTVGECPTRRRCCLAASFSSLMLSYNFLCYFFSVHGL